MSVIPISSAIIPNCNFGSACQLDGNSVFFELKRPKKEAEASDADEAIVADAANEAHVVKKAYEANEANEADAKAD
jgi:hypothetical protein